MKSESGFWFCRIRISRTKTRFFRLSQRRGMVDYGTWGDGWILRLPFIWIEVITKIYRRKK